MISLSKPQALIAVWWSVQFATTICGAHAAYNETRAVQFAHLAAAAGCSSESLQNWSCGKCELNITSPTVCEGKTTHVVIGLWEESCALGFQGTNGLMSLITDLRVSKDSMPWDVCHGCHVHRGFLEEWYSMRQCTIAALKNLTCTAIRTTGWSLGAAVSSIAMLDLHDMGWNDFESYDFGKPRVGDAVFVKTFESKFYNVSWRVTHNKDPIPHVPPGRILLKNWHYEQMEPEAFYRGTVSEGHTECLNESSTECSGQFSNMLLDLVHAADHFNYMDVRMGKADCGKWQMFELPKLIPV